VNLRDLLEGCCELVIDSSTGKIILFEDYRRRVIKLVKGEEQHDIQFQKSNRTSIKRPD